MSGKLRIEHRCHSGDAENPAYHDVTVDRCAEKQRTKPHIDEQDERKDDRQKTGRKRFSSVVVKQEVEREQHEPKSGEHRVLTQAVAQARKRHRIETSGATTPTWKWIPIQAKPQASTTVT